MSDWPKVDGALTEHKSMADLSWLKVGGPADLLFQPKDAKDLTNFLAALDVSIPVMPMGVGSNLIIRDGGLDGVVIRLGRAFAGFEQLDDKTIRVGAAMLDAHVAKKAAVLGIDFAFLRTIPGVIGGAVKMNAGCYGDYMADIFQSALAIDRNGKLVELSPKDVGFGYRSTVIPDDLTIIEVVLKGDVGIPEEIEAKMDKALAKREATQPTKERSCGSTFRNPAGFSSTGEADDVQDLKAWKLIDDAGLRGYSIGGAQMSNKHPNFLVNMGGATAADIEKLGEYVIKRVSEASGFRLEWEIMRVGKPA